MIDFEKTIGNLIETGYRPRAERIQINVPDAREVLKRGIVYFLGRRARWLDAYDEVADWLTDNEGKGLLCRGTCGLGKTVICAQLMPLILNHYCRKIVPVYEAAELGKRADEILAKHLMVSMTWAWNPRRWNMATAGIFFRNWFIRPRTMESY